MKSLDLALFLLVLCMFLQTLKANFLNSTAQAPGLWINNGSLLSNNATSSAVKVRAFLFSQKASFTVFNGKDGNNHSMYSSFACGFYCYNDTCNAFLFGIFITIDNDYNSNTMQDAQIVWTANRSHPVKENATVQLSSDGFVLQDSDGTLVWSAGKSVTSIALFESGNLVLFGSHKNIVWQSFDHPTDTLVLGQTLTQQERIIAGASPINSNPGSFFLSVVDGVLNAFAGYDNPIIYFSSDSGQNSSADGSITYLNGNISFSDKSQAISLPSGTTAQFIRLESDGHLRHYQWLLLGSNATAFWNSSDVLPLDYCDYPLSCGEYGVCSKGQCTCPSGDAYPFLFKPIDNWQPNQGCIPLVPISCNEVKRLMFLPLTRNVTYYDFSNYAYAANEESCKAACLNNCSCKVAFFDHSTNSCYITSEMLSISVSGSDSYNNYHNLSAFIKVQTGTGSGSRNLLTEIVIGSAFSGLFLFFLTVGVVVCYMKKSKKENIEEEDAIPQIPGMPRRFSLAELKLATWDFSEKLGVGGFGSVFEGEIGGEKVAVKRLNSVSQGKVEFLTEVRTIGGINNINLVRLIGYCAEKSERLLVYEYMPGGSLDKWVFDKRQSVFLDWNIRCKLLFDVAKGLLYLHEECRQRITHLDIKPQNILLDDNLNAKVSDFGLAKLIDREQSHVITRMRGTPGYLAPEWLTHVITEKADIYSFGVVILEILCGRRNLDHTQQEENVHLISVLRDKIRKNKLSEIIDSNIVFAELYLEEIIRMIKLAMWCLESDSSRRPNISVVVKILEGAMDFEADLEDHFFNVTPAEVPRIDFPTTFSSPLPESLLSGPR